MKINYPEYQIQKLENHKKSKENTFKSLLFVAVTSCLIFFVIIVGFLYINGLNGFSKYSELNFKYFFTGNYYDIWQKALPGGLLIVNTMWTSFLAILLALPISVMTALFITRVIPKQFKPLMYSIIVLLAAIPSVIYGSFGLGFIDKIINDITSVQGAIISIVFTLALMIIPTITLITVTSINNVDKKMELSSLALGATRSQTNFKVTLKAITSGILTGTILGVGRALGEASAVSMVANETSTLPTFDLFSHTRLLTTSMLKGWKEVASGTVEESYMFALGMLLITTVLIVFSIMKKLQKKYDNVHISKKQSKIVHEKEELWKKMKSGGLENMSITEQNKYYQFKSRQVHQKIKNQEIYSRTYQYSKTTTNPNVENKKKFKSKKLNIITSVFSMIGILSLVAILIYLLSGGVNYLNWDYLTTQGLYETIDGVPIYGLAIPLFGTLLLILLTLIFALPIGILGGIYFAVYSKEGRLNNTLITGVELLTSVPSLIFGLIGFSLFAPLGRVLNFYPLAGALTLTFIVVPTIIKTTEESIRSVNSSHKQASLALGATKSSTTIRIAFPQALPGIISGVLLAIGRILGESAALVILFGTIGRNDASEWVQKGGTTLATEIYRLTGDWNEIQWGAIKAIGIVIILIILFISTLSHYVGERHWRKVIISGMSLIAIFVSIILGIYSLFLVGFIIFLLILFAEIIINIILFSEKKFKIIIIPISLKNLMDRS